MKEKTLAKTFIPIAILVYTIIYLSVIIYGLRTAENIAGVVFYAIILALFLLYFWNFRDKYNCILSLPEDKFKIWYFHPQLENLSFDISQIKSNITLKRFVYGDFVGGFPKFTDYLNYRWYITPEKYTLSFLYGESAEEIEITIQPNLIGFKKLLTLLVSCTNFQIENQKNITTANHSRTLAKVLIALTIAEIDED